jgi:hypothetical protein
MQDALWLPTVPCSFRNDKGYVMVGVSIERVQLCLFNHAFINSDYVGCLFHRVP